MYYILIRFYRYQWSAWYQTLKEEERRATGSRKNHVTYKYVRVLCWTLFVSSGCVRSAYVNLKVSHQILHSCGWNPLSQDYASVKSKDEIGGGYHVTHWLYLIPHPIQHQLQHFSPESPSNTPHFPMRAHLLLDQIAIQLEGKFMLWALLFLFPVANRDPLERKNLGYTGKPVSASTATSLCTAKHLLVMANNDHWWRHVSSLFSF